MASDRSNKTRTGSHEYREGKYYICCMADDTWRLFAGPQGSGKSYDKEFKTLKAARKYCRDNP